MIGQTISHYRILSKLGEGGMGVVYKAEDLTLQRTVALKFLPAESLASASDRSRLVHEARAAAVLLHPNICPVYEIGESEGRTFIAMGYLEGRSLKDLLSDGPLPLDEALRIAKEIGEGLSAAHGKGIVHRDVKPGNVMVTPEGRAVLMDFGLAKMTGATKLTRTGATVGTVAYMSPEQMQGKEVDSRTDIWALGVMLYEMVSGTLPFQGEYEPALFYAIVNADPKPLVGEKIPTGLEGIIAKALAKRASERYATVGELIEDIEELRKDRESLPAGRVRQVSGLTRAWRRWRSWERAAAVTMTCLIVAAIVYGGITLLTPKTETIDSIGFIPLRNLSGDAEGELWADGITGQLSASMGTVTTLKKIVSDQTMKRFKNSTDPLPVIGQKVGVEALVEGSLMLVGDKLEITIKLCEAAKDRQIWANTFNGTTSDAMVLQSQIVRAIADHLKAKLTPASEAQLAVAKPVDPEVYGAYLDGVRLGSRLGGWNHEQALDRFRRALQIDPNFAPAYAGMANVYVGMALFYEKHPDEVGPLARSVAVQAVQLDEKSADAHAAMAWVKLNFDADWSGAEAEYERALAISPNSGWILQGYAMLLMVKGRTEESVAIARRIQDMGFGDLVWTFFEARRYDELIEFMMKGHASGSTPPPDAFLMSSYVLTRRYNEAAEMCDALESLPGYRDNQWDLGFVGWAYGVMGRRDKALEILKRLSVLANELEEKRKYVDPYNVAMVAAGLGDKDQAFAALRKCIEIRQPARIQMPIDPFFDNLHSDPRWQELLRAINYPSTS
jgi:TolB-like protein/predicted Ser/Thr protein kinase